LYGGTNFMSPSYDAGRKLFFVHRRVKPAHASPEGRHRQTRPSAT
jgi:hypothetical protein